MGAQSSHKAAQLTASLGALLTQESCAAAVTIPGGIVNHPERKLLQPVTPCAWQAEFLNLVCQGSGMVDGNFHSNSQACSTTVVPLCHGLVFVQVHCLIKCLIKYMNVSEAGSS